MTLLTSNRYTQSYISRKSTQNCAPLGENGGDSYSLQSFDQYPRMPNHPLKINSAYNNVDRPVQIFLLKADGEAKVFGIKSMYGTSI